jgi:hypothetical protein
MNAMSDIVVKRFNVHKKPQDQIKTRLIYAPKQRVLADLLDRDQNLQLPVMSCSIGGIARDAGRVFNKILGMYNTTTGNSVVNEKMPIPIDMTMNVSLMTRYQSDMDQILTHLLPYINPYFTVSWRTPGRPDFEIRSNVFWSGNVSFNYPIEVTANQAAKVVADLSFTFKGWLFQALPDDTIGTVLTINANYETVPQAVPLKYLPTDEIRLSSTETSDYLTYEGAPPQPKIVLPFTAQTNQLKEFVVYGPGFTKILNVYLSGAPLSDISTLQDPFSANTDLSGTYTPFTAVKLASSLWSSDNSVSVTFVMPSLDIPGKIDVILEGPFGYGKLTDYVRVNDYNPHPPEILFEPIQLPFLNGIQVF